MKQFNIYFIIYFILLIYIVFIYGVRDRMTIEIRDTHLNLVPFVHTENDMTFLLEKGLRRHMNLFENTIGNIVLFIPFSFILLYKQRDRNVRAVILSGIVASMTIECMQYFFLLGVTDIDDVILNTVGLGLGACLAFIACRK